MISCGACLVRFIQGDRDISWEDGNFDGDEIIDSSYMPQRLGFTSATTSTASRISL